MALATLAPLALGQTGPSCGNNIVFGGNPNAYSVGVATDSEWEGAALDDCFFSVTAAQGQHYVSLNFVESFGKWIDYGDCLPDDGYCDGSVTATLTSGGTTLDTTVVSGNGAVGPTADSGPTWNYVSTTSGSPEIETYRRTVTKLIDVSALTASGPATLQWEVDATEGYYGPISDSLNLYPGDSNLVSFAWGQPSESPIVSFSMYYDSTNGGNGYWQGDKLADEGDTLMSPPQWIGSTGESDPAGYLYGATPMVFNVSITRPDGFTGSARLRIVEASGLLVFPDTTVPLTSGAATYSYAITSSQAVPSYIDVLNPSDLEPFDRRGHHLYPLRLDVPHPLRHRWAASWLYWIRRPSLVAAHHRGAGQLCRFLA
jgi:hypothetical protein